MSDEVLVKVEGISKRFCRSLKRSLWYGVQDIVRDLNPFHDNGSGPRIDTNAHEQGKSEVRRQNAEVGNGSTGDPPVLFGGPPKVPLLRAGEKVAAGRMRCEPPEDAKSSREQDYPLPTTHCGERVLKTEVGS